MRGRDRKRTEPDRITQADLARVIGTNPQYVNSLVRSGAIKTLEDRTIPIHDAYARAVSSGHTKTFREWYSHTHGVEFDPASAPREIAIEAPTLPPERPGFAANRPPAIRKTIDHWKRLGAKEAALKARLERMKIEGRLVEVAAVRAHLADNAILIRDRLMQIPDRVAPDVVALTAQGARDLLRREIAEVLLELADDIPTEPTPATQEKVEPE